MYLLYHHPICPFSRQIRVILAESKITFDLHVEKYWQNTNSLFKVSPSGELPVLISDKKPISSITAILEYINDKHSVDIMPKDIYQKAETRRLNSWFNIKFYQEVVKYIVDERFVKLMSNVDYPRIATIKIAKQNFHYHALYLTSIINEHNNLVQEQVSVADIVCASHFSILDYFGDIEWDRYPELRQWYTLIKSRPSFKQILKDYVIGIAPHHRYTKLDF